MTARDRASARWRAKQRAVGSAPVQFWAGSTLRQRLAAVAGQYRLPQGVLVRHALDHALQRPGHYATSAMQEWQRTQRRAWLRGPRPKVEAEAEAT